MKVVKMTTLVILVLKNEAKIKKNLFFAEIQLFCIVVDGMGAFMERLKETLQEPKDIQVMQH